MSKAITPGQARSLIGSFTIDTPWEGLEAEVQEFIELPPAERGKRFADFLKNGCRLIVMLAVFAIDRAKKFNPAEFIGEGWKVWQGLADGNGLDGDEEQDKNSIALTQIDLSKVNLISTLKKGETSITGEENLRRLQTAGYTRLDAAVFQYLWEHQELIPESWKERVNGNVRFIYFDGTVLRHPHGNRYVLFLYWHDGRWGWNALWLDYHRIAPLPVCSSRKVVLCTRSL